MMRFKSVCCLLSLVTAAAWLTGCPTAPGTPAAGTPALAVYPTALSFGSDGIEASFYINNTGGGTLTWNVSADVSWISVDTPSGSTSTGTSRVKLTADRSTLTASPVAYPGTITVSSNGGTKTIPISLRVQGTPLIQVNPATLNLLDTVDSGTFTVANLGDGDLAWQINVRDATSNSLTTQLPSYLTVSPDLSVTPAGGNTDVTVTVDRSAVPDGVTSVTLYVVSDVSIAQVTVNLAASGGASQAEIGVDPASLDFSDTETTLTLNVFNSGPSQSVLDFVLSTDNPNLIKLEPQSGTSIGTDDAQTVNKVPIKVTINRAAIQSTQDGGNITISADGLDSIDVPVTVKRAALTLEGAENRARPPYIERFVFLIRNDLGEAIDTLDPTVLSDLQSGFSIQENGVPLDVNETNMFVTSAANLKTNLVLLLDYTGSMYDASPGSGAVISQMEDAARGFIQDVPSSFRLALMEYHDRQQSTRLIHNFTTQRDSLMTALDNFNVPAGDNGASQIYDAIVDACDRLANEDANVLPFNDADVRGIVFISDGRDTSSESSLSEAITAATDNHVRLYPIGFGEDVNEAPLIQMATESGGHYYAAPTAADLTSLLEGNTSTGASGLISYELSRQVVLTYVSLLSTAGTYLISLDYGGNTGSFERDAIFLPGDSRAGQISLSSTGVNGDTAEVFVRTDYVPRGISQIRFRIISAFPTQVELAPGGLLDDGNWTLIDEGAQDASLAGVYTAITDDTHSLPIGAFGQLLKVTISGINVTQFTMGFRVDNRIYINPPFTKFFQYPDGIVVGDGSSQAGIVPLTLDDNFDPNAPFAFDRDKDGVPDFNDMFPDDENFH